MINKCYFRITVSGHQYDAWHTAIWTDRQDKLIDYMQYPSILVWPARLSHLGLLFIIVTFAGQTTLHLHFLTMESKVVQRLRYSLVIGDTGTRGTYPPLFIRFDEITAL